MKRTYLDYAAAAPVTASARRAFVDALGAYGNPSSPHEEGRRARAVLLDARTRIARLCGTRADAIIFTSGATEANNLALRGAVAASQHATPHILYAAGMHPSLSETIAALSREGCIAEELPFMQGALDTAALLTKLRPDTVLVAVERVNSETGMCTETLGLRKLLDAHHASPVLLLVDASQSPRVESFERTRLGADLLTLDAQKVGGVRGVGCLVRAVRAPLTPILYGGGQEGGMRSGTPSPALAAAFAAALETCAAERARFIERAARMRARLLAHVMRDVNDVYVNEGIKTAPHFLNMSFLGRDTDYLVALLDAEGFMVSARSACDTDSAQGSRAVLAQTNNEERARSALRISFGPSSTEGDIQRFGNALVRAVRFLDEHAV